MRLLYVADRFPVLSETFVVDEVRGLVRAGDDVTVYARRGGDPAVASDLAELVIGPGASLPVRALPVALGLRERGAVHALAEATWLARRVRAERVHAHFAFGNATVALLYGRLTGVPASFTAHAVDLYGGVPSAILKRKIAAADFVAAVSEHGAAALRACAAPADQHKVVVQRTGVERDAIRAGAPEWPPRIIAIARLVEKKGLDVLLLAAQSLGPSVFVEILGEGPERGRLEMLSRGSGLSVRFTGALPHDAALRRLIGAYAFVLPCRQLRSGDQDGLPVALIEAMCAGVPVVTTPVAGIPELVHDGESGLLVSPDDPPALAAALSRLFDDRALRDRLAAAGRAATDAWDRDGCIRALRARFS